MFPTNQEFVMFCFRACGAHYASVGAVSRFMSCPWCGSSLYGRAQFKRMHQGTYADIIQRGRRVGGRWKGLEP